MIALIFGVLAAVLFVGRREFAEMLVGLLEQIGGGK